MNSRRMIVVCLLLAAALLLAGCPPEEDDNQSCEALNHPDKFAWEILAEISQPARNGTPDAQWETWASKDDVYHSPAGSPQFPNSHRPLALHPAVFEQVETVNQSSQADKPIARANVIPNQPLSEEIRMNYANFHYIVENHLWDQAGQMDAFRHGKVISFPQEAREIKAQWKSIDASDKHRFHWNLDEHGNLYGLVALHITTKDTPNWFWATFEHVENPYRCHVNGCSDSFGLESSKNPSPQLLDLLKRRGLGHEWTYYRLTGSQTNFVSSTGNPTLLGNSYIEGKNRKSQGFMACSSCISCHAEPRINQNGFAPEPFETHVGPPDPKWFFGERPAMQLDFVWSLTEPWPRASGIGLCN